MEFFFGVGSFHPRGKAGYSLWKKAGEELLFSPLACDLPDISAGTSCTHPHLPVIYLTDERRTNPDYTFGGGGRVFAMRIDPGNGHLTEINHVLSFGAAPSAAAVTADGRFLLVSNFGDRKEVPAPSTLITRDESGTFQIRVRGDDATLSLFALQEDGAVGALQDVFVFPAGGTDTHPRAPHAHCVVRAPLDDLFAVCETGNDKICFFRVDETKDGAVLSPCPAFACPKESAPRYGVFHPDRPFLFVNFEDRPLVASYRFGTDGITEVCCELTLLQDVEKTGTEDGQSGLCISPDGRYLYTAMRGKNLLFVLESSGKDGTLLLRQALSLRGDRPKDVRMTPDGKFLAVAMRESNAVEWYRVAADGTLSFTDTILSHPAAGHVFFYETNL